MTEMGRDTPSHKTGTSQFVYAVGIYGNYAIVGDSNNKKAYLYKRGRDGHSGESAWGRSSCSREWCC